MDRDPRGEGGSFATTLPERVGDPLVTNLSRVDQIAESARAAPTLSPSAPAPSFASYGKEAPAAEGGDTKDDDNDSDAAGTRMIEARAPLWKSVLVNDKARIRRISKDHRPKAGNGGGAVKRDVYNYGLTKSKSDKDVTEDRRIYENLYAEMDEFWSYMTVPRASTLADPTLRDQTANVYMTHARLFLGWVVDARGVLCDDGGDALDALLRLHHDAGGGAPPPSLATSPIGAGSSLGPALAGALGADSVRARVWTGVLERVRDDDAHHRCEDPDRESRGAPPLRRSASLRDVFPTPATESAAPILQYVLWLRSVRGISPNYEANV